MTKLTPKDVENITTVIFPSWKEACNSFLESEMHIFDCWEKACDSFLENEIHILEFAKAYYDDVQKIPKIKEGFNIFTAIAEKYRYENLHSDLLKVILGNEKNNIRNQNIFYNFLKYIDISETEQKKYFPNYENIKFYREYPKGKKDAKDIKKYGFIDLLIYTEKACIIIENKINGAPDQPNQLGKYYARMAQEGKEFIKIVYLTIDSKHTQPSNFEDYDTEFKDFVPKINTNFIHHPCVTAENTDDRSFTKFLEKIINESKKGSIKLDETEKVFINQYKSLLESIGGQVFMEQYKKDFIKDIMKDTGSIQTATDFANNFKKFWDNKKKHTSGPEKDLVEKIKEKNYTDTANYLAENFKEIWNLRPTIIGELLVDEKDITSFKMEIAPDDPTIRQKKITEKVFIYYTYNDPKKDGSRNCNIEFGFRPTDNFFSKELANKLKEAFEQVNTERLNFGPKGGFDPAKGQEIKWVYAHVNESDLGYLTYDEIKSELGNYLKKLNGEANKVLDSQ